MNGQERPTCWIVAGPNGAGRTTFALKYLPEVAGCRNFVNADLIAAGMSPLAPERERVTGDHATAAESEAVLTQGHEYEAMVLDVLKRAVAEALDRKRRLGRYAVVWREGRAVCIGPDAPVVGEPHGAQPTVDGGTSDK